MEPPLLIDYNFPTNTHYRTIICQTDKIYETLLDRYDDGLNL